MSEFFLAAEGFVLPLFTAPDERTTLIQKCLAGMGTSHKTLFFRNLRLEIKLTWECQRVWESSRDLMTMNLFTMKGIRNSFVFKPTF